jgi:hypothetical protein
MFKPKQLSLSDIYADCFDSLENNKPLFLTLLEENIDLNEFIPRTFWDHFYAVRGRHRKYPLTAFIWALLLQRIFSVPTDTLLITFLRCSKELRDFCGFTKVPDPSKFTRFKQTFIKDFEALFDKLVDVTEPICARIDKTLSSMSVFDTSGIEAYVAENNPKYVNSVIDRLKTYKKVANLGDDFDPYKAAYGSMPPHAAANPAVKQLYINGHFCYVYKFGLVTNGLGIVRHISFYNREFFDAHPDIVALKKSDSPEEDKSLGDARALLPTLRDFFDKHPQINPDVFLGDAAFDSVEIYRSLFNDFRFNKAFIPLNARASSSIGDCPVNEDGVPCCPKDSSLPMRPESSKSHLRCGLSTFKFVCPKMKWIRENGKSKRRTSCEDPCTNSPCGRMFYVYPEKNLRTCPGVVRGTDEWNETYKIRSVVEKAINHFKDSFVVAGRRTQNETTLHADLLLAGITQLITVILAEKIHRRDCIRSLKPLIAS